MKVLVKAQPYVSNLKKILIVLKYLGRIQSSQIISQRYFYHLFVCIRTQVRATLCLTDTHLERLLTCVVSSLPLITCVL